MATSSSLAAVRPRHFHPLIGFLVPTAIIGYGVVLPRHDLGELYVGFAGSLVGAAITYVVGVLAALRR